MSHDILMSREEMAADIEKCLASRWYRLNHLYWIVDEKGVKVLFKVNPFQYVLYRALWYLNIVLKARQLGITTFVCIMFLDDCLFTENLSAAVIADTREHASDIFEKKIQFPFDNLPDWIKNLETVKVDTDTAQKLVFANGSSIQVATSLRSGTYQRVLISEFGKICAKYPEKAQEIVSGAFNTVHPGSIVIVESTAEGSFGHFYEYSMAALALRNAGKKLTNLDFKFFFFPWWQDRKYRLDASGVVVDRDSAQYFGALERRTGVGIDPEQRAWYVKKAEQQKENMKREFPSFPEEAFEAAIEGSYYGKWVDRMISEKRVRPVPHDERLDVDTWWDLGMDDSMSIIFTQQVGGEIRVIDYIEASGEGLAFYARELERRSDEKNYRYGTHHFPHDGNVRELGTGRSRVESAEEYGITPIVVLPRLAVHDGIQAARSIFSRLYIDEQNCPRLVKALKFYRKSWDDVRAMWSDKPFHDEWSHGADAFRALAVGVSDTTASIVPGASKVVEPDDSGYTMSDYEKHGLVVGRPF